MYTFVHCNKYKEKKTDGILGNMAGMNSCNGQET